MSKRAVANPPPKVSSYRRTHPFANMAQHFLENHAREQYLELQNLQQRGTATRLIIPTCKQTHSIKAIHHLAAHIKFEAEQQ